MNNPTNILAVTAALLCGSATATAGIPSVLFEIVAQNQTDSASYQVMSNMGSFQADGAFLWESAGAIDLVDGNQNVIATLTSGLVRFAEDPWAVSIGFTVIAGSTDTTFSISSGTLTYGPLGSPEARASGAIGMTDTFGSDGGSISGSSIMTAYTNNGLYAGLLGGVSVAANDSDNTFGNTGAFAPLGAASSESRLSFDFTLTAGDTANGNGIFVVTPAPGALALLGVAAVGARRRR